MGKDESRDQEYGGVESVDNLVIGGYLLGLLIFGINGIIMIGMKNTHDQIVRDREETNRLLMKIRMNKRRF